MNLHGIQFPDEQLAEFCRKSRIARLSVFGSILREDFGAASDIDMLVEFEPGQTPSIMRMVELENDLSSIIGRTVDLRTPAELSRHFRDEVLREARPQYVAA